MQGLIVEKLEMRVGVRQAGWLGAWIRASMARIVARRRMRATIRSLQGLDDRMLKDIGLDRLEIESAARTRCLERRQTFVA